MVFVVHIPEDLLERYAMGMLSDSETGPLEEHLLVCHECQDRLRAVDEYVAAIRAAAEFEREDNSDLGISYKRNSGGDFLLS